MWNLVIQNFSKQSGGIRTERILNRSPFVYMRDLYEVQHDDLWNLSFQNFSIRSQTKRTLNDIYYVIGD